MAIENKTIEQLLHRQKLLKVLLVVLAIILIVLLVLSLTGQIATGGWALPFAGLAFSMSLITLQLSTATTELERREKDA